MEKFQIPNLKFQINSNESILKDQNKKIKIYDLEDRTFRFARDANLYCKELPYSLSNIEYVKQLARAAGSVGANYIEANEALSKKDFVMRIKICRKEAKKCIYWFDLIVSLNNDAVKKKGLALKEEATQLKKIFSAIIGKSV